MRDKEGSMLKEFQEFIAKGNVMDLAVGVIIGGAFGLIVSSLVADIIMPIVGAIFGGFDFSNYFLPLSSSVTAVTLEEAKKQGAVFAYGNFFTVVINFLILAWIIFLMVKGVNTMRKRLEKQAESAPPPPPAADVVLLTEIRDLLAKK
jgi:large conductance mechanosensitive channel